MMDKHVTELYESAGVDTKGLAHKVRQRWNKLTQELRADELDRIGERRYAHLRWDQLPNNIQKAVVASVRRRQKREKGHKSAQSA